ncbi:hypothetical protein F4809DRAFT_574548 [Biscogniauxia mediterranea]|nr:hypothetical protein F4809DRAFT_574548 [Biscogniauxia mediterranea]
MTDNGNSPANAGINKLWFDKIPNEIMLQIISLLMEETDIINLAVAQPDRFLAPTLNVFQLDAEKQVRLQAGRSSPELTEAPEDTPLLNIAVKNGYGVGIIRSIVEAYQVACPDSINGIWGQVPRAVEPPLHCAVEAARVEVISLLLDLGADPQIKFMKVPTTGQQRTCDYEGLAHQECMNGGEVVSSKSTTCENPLEAAITTDIKLWWLPRKRRANIDCAMELFHRAPSLQPSLNTHWLILASRSGIYDLIKERLDMLAARDDDDEEKQDFRSTCSTFLGRIAIEGKTDAGELIEYLGELGAPNYLIEPIYDPAVYAKDIIYPGISTENSDIRSACNYLHEQNAGSLLKAMIRRGVRLHAEVLRFCILEDRHINFTKFFIPALKDGSFADYPKENVPKYMEELLTAAMAQSADETCKYLISEGCPVTSEHLELAIRYDKASSARRYDKASSARRYEYTYEAMIRSGMETNGPSLSSWIGAVARNLFG